MPGLVLDVKVDVGQAVKEGDTVLFTKYGPTEIKIDGKEYDFSTDIVYPEKEIKQIEVTSSQNNSRLETSSKNIIDEQKRDFEKQKEKFLLFFP